MAEAGPVESPVESPVDGPEAEAETTNSAPSLNTYEDEGFDDDEDGLLAAIASASLTTPTTATTTVTETMAEAAPEVAAQDLETEARDAVTSTLAKLADTTKITIEDTAETAVQTAAQADDALIASLGALIEPESDELADLPEADIALADAPEAVSQPDTTEGEAEAVKDQDLAIALDDDHSHAEKTAADSAADNADADQFTQDAPFTEDAAQEFTPEDTPSEDVIAQDVAPEELVAEEIDAADPSGIAEADLATQDEAAKDLAAYVPQAENDATPAAPVVPVRPVRPVRPTRGQGTSEARPEPLPVPKAPVARSEEQPDSEEPVTVEKLQRARARVIKIRRHELQPARQADEAPAPAAAAPATTTPMVTPTALLSQEAEAALAAELAALEAEATDAPAASVSPDRPARAAEGHERLTPAGDEAVNRLMAEASSQMEGTDTKRRQSAIAHLKAAVAATIAERRATGHTLAEDGKDPTNAYRNDLAKVVRPATSAAPTAARPAPLVLVSEQRIDRPAAAAPASVQPVRPRRLGNSGSAAALQNYDDLTLDEGEDDFDDIPANIFEANQGFADFADRLGATDLPDVLEAAAAFIACVEGREGFTRPQLMRHVGSANDGLSREDSLRSFGLLLRDGRIVKDRRGLFTLPEGAAILTKAKSLAG